MISHANVPTVQVVCRLYANKVVGEGGGERDTGGICHTSNLDGNSVVCSVKIIAFLWCINKV